MASIKSATVKNLIRDSVQVTMTKGRKGWGKPWTIENCISNYARLVQQGISNTYNDKYNIALICGVNDKIKIVFITIHIYGQSVSKVT